MVVSVAMSKTYIYRGTPLSFGKLATIAPVFENFSTVALSPPVLMVGAFPFVTEESCQCVSRQKYSDTSEIMPYFCCIFYWPFFGRIFPHQ